MTKKFSIDRYLIFLKKYLFHDWRVPSNAVGLCYVSDRITINLNPKQGLLNGTRLKVKKLGNKMIEAQIISGKKVEPMFSFPV